MSNERTMLVAGIIIAGLFLGSLFYKNQDSINLPFFKNDIEKKQDQLNIKNIFKIARDNNKLVVLFFTRSDCPPCEKMKLVIANPEVQKELSNYLFLQVDTNADPAVAQMFQIKATPTMVLINGDMQIQRTQEGLMTVNQFISWLGGTSSSPQKEPESPPQTKPGRKKQQPPPNC
jgi:thioredoxin-related protein